MSTSRCPHCLEISNPVITNNDVLFWSCGCKFVDHSLADKIIDRLRKYSESLEDDKK